VRARSSAVRNGESKQRSASSLAAARRIGRQSGTAISGEGLVTRARSTALSSMNSALTRAELQLGEQRGDVLRLVAPVDRQPADRRARSASQGDDR
jgi:hypothetical protein